MAEQQFFSSHANDNVIFQILRGMTINKIVCQFFLLRPTFILVQMWTLTAKRFQPSNIVFFIFHLTNRCCFQAYSKKEEFINSVLFFYVCYLKLSVCASALKIVFGNGMNERYLYVEYGAFIFIKHRWYGPYVASVSIIQTHI